MKRFFITLFLLLFPCINYPLAFSNYEARGLWVVRHTLSTRQSIYEALIQARANNFNMVFIQVVGRGDAFYNSHILPKSEVLSDADDNFDPLQYALDLGHELGLEVHAWVNVYYIWSAKYPPRDSNHIYHRHPEWMLVDNMGRSVKDYTHDEKKDRGVEGVYISPGNPAVRNFLRSIVGEITDNYDVDGIHLDYVRYPSPNFSYDSVTRARFEKEFRVDPLDLTNGYGNWDNDEYHRLLVQWKDWRAGQVSKLVRGIYYDLQSKKDSNFQLSAAVIADLDYARTRFGQRWDEWLREGIIDFVVPMAYFKDTNKVVDHMTVALQNQYGRHVYAGLGVYNQDPASSIEKIHRVRQLGAKGIVLFSYDGIKNDPLYFYALKDGPMRYAASCPNMPWVQDKDRQIEETFTLKLGLPKWTVSY